MPRRRKYVRRRYKRTYARRYKRAPVRRRRRRASYKRRRTVNARGPPVTYVKGGSALPLVLKNRMQYADYKTVNQAGAKYAYKWAVNSTYDPDNSGLGGKAPNFNELATLYDVNCVDYCTVKYTMVNQTARPYMLSFVLQRNSDYIDFSDTSLYNIKAAPGFLKQVTIGRPDQPQGTRTVYLRINVWSWIKKLLFPQAFGTSMSNSLWGTSGSSPAEVMILSVFVSALDENPANTMAYEYKIEMNQYTRWAKQDTTFAVAYD